MSGLVLKLSPKERVLVNGAVIENGDRRSRLSIMTPGANILRLRDAIHPEEAKPQFGEFVIRFNWFYLAIHRPRRFTCPCYVKLKNSARFLQIRTVVSNCTSQRKLLSPGSTINALRHFAPYCRAKTACLPPAKSNGDEPCSSPPFLLTV